MSARPHVVERSGHQYMLAHSSMFDEHWITSQQAALGTAWRILLATSSTCTLNPRLLSSVIP